jgi:hypothetical protein
VLSGCRSLSEAAFSTSNPVVNAAIYSTRSDYGALTKKGSGIWSPPEIAHNTCVVGKNLYNIYKKEHAMGKKTIFVASFFLVILIFFGYSTASATATNCEGLTELEDQIECAIQEGLEYMIDSQDPGGWWESMYTNIAPTGLMCGKLLDRARELGVDPFSGDYEYSTNLLAAINYIASLLESDKEGLAILTSQQTVYNTGICAMCLADAASVNPEGTAEVASGDVLTYQAITQALVDWLEASQNEFECAEGGWFYTGDTDVGWADNSVTGYATLGIGFASSLVGIDISAMLPPLNVFIDNVQQNGGVYDGGSIYEACTPTRDTPGINILKTGNLLYELGLVGDQQGDDRVDRAVDFIVRYWANFGGSAHGSGWRGDYQAMFTMMKGLEGLGIDILPNPYNGDIDWFAEVASYIVTNQYPDGHWFHTHSIGSIPLDTAWALLTLEKAVPELTPRVGFDIKPGSCPNPINVKSKGALPAAIMGTAALDVTQLDPETLRLRLKGTEGPLVAPLRWALADVGEPFVPYAGKEDCFADCIWCSCADGFMDLVFHFDTQEVVAALGEVSDEDCLVVEIIGNFQEEYNGTSFVGEDVVRILKKGR